MNIDASIIHRLVTEEIRGTPFEPRSEWPRAVVRIIWMGAPRVMAREELAASLSDRDASTLGVGVPGGSILVWIDSWASNQSCFVVLDVDTGDLHAITEVN